LFLLVMPGKQEEVVHVRKLPWYDQAVIAYQCSSCCENSLLSVCSQR
jgi:hypothetical protein